MKFAAAALLLVAGCVAAQPAIDPAVEKLLQAVAISGCQMERNGEMHDAKAAADHLRMKLARSGRPTMAPEQFIDHVASGSTVTGQPYRVHCPGQPVVDSRTWLRGLLARQNSRP